MPITIDGSGSITGLSAGGLPDLSVTTDEIAAAAVTAPKLSGAQSGSAPIYGARAWVNFNGSGTVAIRSSGNVSSITDNGLGDYTVNFTTAMEDADYCCSVAGADSSGIFGLIRRFNAATTTAQRFLLTNTSANGNDVNIVNVAIFR